jgi:prephenate dehydratase
VNRKLVRVSFQGEKGAFSQVAVRQLLGDHTDVLPCTRFDEVFRSLVDRRVDAAVVPIENTLVGSIHENYDNLLEYNLPIVAETNVRIVHNLIGPPSVPLKKIRKVYSHPVALNQCLRFFASHPEIERVPFYDTAGSVKMLMEENRTDAAAIASSVAAEMYGARILKRSIEDDRENFTRFFLLRRPGARGVRQQRENVQNWKTSLVFTTAKNLPGSLFRSLSAFALRDLSLTKIESRPLRGKPFEYLFYLDFLGRIEDTKPRNALAHLNEMADFVRVLGCYPCGA